MENVFQSTFIETAFSKLGMPFLKVILVLLVFFWLLKKISVEKKIINNSSVKILEKIRIGSHESVIIVKLDDVRLVIGVTSNNISLLYIFPSKKI
ncbi:MAG: flagellar biosynthetic protein FliO [Buchnera aphidicola (Nurudea yanoniella)]